MNPVMDWLQLGVAGGALATLIIIVRALMKHQEKQQGEVLIFFGNHMSDVVDTQRQMTDALTGLTAEIKAMRYEIRATGRVDSRVKTE